VVSSTDLSTLCAYNRSLVPKYDPQQTFKKGQTDEKSSQNPTREVNAATLTILAHFGSRKLGDMRPIFKISADRYSDANGMGIQCEEGWGWYEQPGGSQWAWKTHAKWSVHEHRALWPAKHYTPPSQKGPNEPNGSIGGG